MRELADIDVLTDERVRLVVARVSLAVLVACAALGVVLRAAGLGRGLVGEVARMGPIAWAASLVAGVLVSLPVHELVHAALFRLAGGPGTRVRFGASSGMLYAGCPGLELGRAPMSVVLVGPAVVLSVALLAFGGAVGLPDLGYLWFACHLSGCAGDLYFVWRIWREPACTRVRDTERGIALLG